MIDLSLHLADPAGLRWAQQQVTDHHYLHHPIDVRSRPVAYIVRYQDEPMGCLIFGRAESTRCTGWYGSCWDVAKGVCPLTRWQVLNLARVWLHPDLQANGRFYVPNAASWCISQALRRVGCEYLIEKPPVWMDEPYEIRECLSYCDTRIHHGALYRACNFTLKRTNERGIETYVRPLRRLTHAEHATIAQRSHQDQRARRLRSDRTVTQESLFAEYEVAI